MGGEGGLTVLHEGGLQSQWLLQVQNARQSSCPAQEENRHGVEHFFRHAHPKVHNPGEHKIKCSTHQLGRGCVPPSTQPPQPHTNKPQIPATNTHHAARKCCVVCIFFCPIGMKGGEEGSARVGSGGTCGEGGAVGGAVVMQNVLFVS